tara:strand:+ start:288 stop:449 length:162 start_codon:yes stop_codon:yes gene_type:complete
MLHTTALLTLPEGLPLEPLRKSAAALLLDLESDDMEDIEHVQISDEENSHAAT